VGMRDKVAARSTRSRSPPRPSLSEVSPHDGGRSPLSPSNRFNGRMSQPQGYNTRSAKKQRDKDVFTSPGHGGTVGKLGEEGAQAGSSMTTRRQATMQAESLPEGESDDLPGVERMQIEERGGAAGRAEQSASSSQLGAAMEGQESDHGSGSARVQLTRANNPVVRLTVKLLHTYQGINEKYYAKANQRNNNGYDDENGDYIIRAGDIVNGRYKIHRRPNGASPLLGKGSFGQVVYALDLKVNSGATGPGGQRGEVALKIIKNHRHWHEQAKCEIDLLKSFTKLRAVPGHGDWVDYSNVVRLLDDFVFRNHCCLVFELLPFTLYDLLKYSRFRGVSLQLVSKFAMHLVRTLHCLRQPEVDVIHCDLKPENVMLVKHDDHRVKVIDFGSSCTSRRQPFTYIQSRFYRSPEVLLCRPYNHAIDMWSLGCILVEMHSGQPLFNGKNEAEQIRKICDVLGMPPPQMISHAGPKCKVNSLFRKDANGEYMIVTDTDSFSKPRRNFRDIIRNPAVMLSPEQERMYVLFEDLLRKMLVFDPELRITPEQALKHAFLNPGAEVTPRRDHDQMEMSPRPETPVTSHTTPRSSDKVDQAVQTQR